MQYRSKHKVIAALLLTVFSLNTMAGFACSIGINMGYNVKHHEHRQMDHGKGNATSCKHKHSVKHNHKHTQHVSTTKLTPINDDCCSNQVNSFALLNKSLPANNSILKAPVLSIVSIPAFLISLKTESALSVNSRFQFVRRSCSLNDTDIRVAIQSFQI